MSFKSPSASEKASVLSFSEPRQRTQRSGVDRAADDRGLVQMHPDHLPDHEMVIGWP